MDESTRSAGAFQSYVGGEATRAAEQARDDFHALLGILSLRLMIAPVRLEREHITMARLAAERGAELSKALIEMTRRRGPRLDDSTIQPTQGFL
jgi:hypothetical protein